MCYRPQYGDGVVVKLDGRELSDVAYVCQSRGVVEIYQHQRDPATGEYVRFREPDGEWAVLSMEGNVQVDWPERKAEPEQVGRDPLVIDGRTGTKTDPYIPDFSLRAIMIADVLSGHSRRYALFIDNYGQIPGEWTVFSVVPDIGGHQVTVGFADMKMDPFADDPEVFIQLRCPVIHDMGETPLLDSSFRIRCGELACDTIGVDELFQYIRRNS